MRRFDGLHRAAGSATSIAKSIFDHRDSVLELLRNNFSPEVVGGLAMGRMLVPESVIWREIQRLPEAADRVDSIHCHVGGIDICAHGTSAGASIELRACLRIRELEISEKRQELVADLSDLSAHGRGLWGEIVCRIAGLFVDSFALHAVRHGDWSGRVSFSPDGRTATVSLADVPAILKLLERQIPALADSVPLRIVSATGAAHVENGINLQLCLMPGVEAEKAPIKDLLGAGKKLAELLGL